MAKQIFVHFLSASGGRHLDDVPLFNMLTHEEWMTETDVADLLRKRFADLFSHHKLELSEVASFEDQEGKAVPIEEVAEATIICALNEDLQFWWLVDESADVFDVYDEHKQKMCLISCMDAAAKDAGWT